MYCSSVIFLAEPPIKGFTTKVFPSIEFSLKYTSATFLFSSVSINLVFNSYNIANLFLSSFVTKSKLYCPSFLRDKDLFCRTPLLYVKNEFNLEIGPILILALLALAREAI